MKRPPTRLVVIVASFREAECLFTFCQMTDAGTLWACLATAPAVERVQFPPRMQSQTRASTRTAEFAFCPPLHDGVFDL